MADLKAFLRRLAREPFSYGELDCASVLGRWWEINHGVNPGAHLLGTYHDADACADVLMQHRGLLRLVFNICRSIGAQRTSDPQPGDFGVVRMGHLHFGAIRTPSGRWAIKCSDGLRVTQNCKPIMMWSI
jgi:hypothetical protein